MVAKTDKRTSMGLSQITASAITPDQLIPYVKAVSGLDSRMFGNCVGHYCEGQIVLIGYPMGKPLDKNALDAAVGEALQTKGLQHITVLCAEKPSQAPENASVSEDAYWSLPLPLPPCKQKLRNMLARAKRDIRIEESGAEGYGQEHEAIVKDFCSRRKLEPGMIHIFHQLKKYLTESPNARLFSARTKDGTRDGTVVAFAIGDYSSFNTAFYMFACRLPSAPPGTADALLEAVAKGGEERGHSQLNLGLAVNAGIGFFKKKWGAEFFLPCYEYGWDIQPEKKGWLARLLGA